VFFARPFSTKMQNVFPKSCMSIFLKVANFLSLLLGTVTGFAFPSAFKIDPVLPLVFPDIRGYQQPSFRHAF